MIGLKCLYNKYMGGTMDVYDLYSYNNCIKDRLRFLNVGNTDLERNNVYYDTKEHIYVKHYRDRNHYKNELQALLFYSNYALVPNIIHNLDMCICISSLKGSIIEDDEINFNVYAQIGHSLSNLHLNSQKIFHRPLDINGYFLYEKKRLDNLFKKIDFRNQMLYEMLLCILKKDIYEANSNLVLCHNDFCNRNILISNGKVSGIIDFEKSHFADPMCDLATIIIKKYKTKCLTEVLNGYFEHKISYNEKQRIVYFAIYKALEITTWAKNKDIKFYNKAVDFLKEWKLLYDII